jgi:hypothetical protein
MVKDDGFAAQWDARNAAAPVTDGLGNQQYRMRAHERAQVEIQVG